MKFSHSWRRYRKAILALFFCTDSLQNGIFAFQPNKPTEEELNKQCQKIAGYSIQGNTDGQVRIFTLGSVAPHAGKTCNANAHQYNYNRYHCKADIVVLVKLNVRGMNKIKHNRIQKQTDDRRHISIPGSHAR